MVIFLWLSLSFLFLWVRWSSPSGGPVTILPMPFARFIQVRARNIRRVLLSLTVSSSFILLSFPLLAYADTATSSNASRSDRDIDWDMDVDDIRTVSPSNAAYTDVDLLMDDRTLMDIDDFEGLKRDDLLRYILCELITIRDSFGGFGLASSPDASLSSLEVEEDSSDLEEGPTDIVPMDTSLRSARSVSVSDDYINVLRYDVSISGREYTLLFPPEYADSLYIDSQGRLFNVSANTIQGRLVDGNFNPYAKEGKLVYLTPCLGNNFYSIREYGSPNYVREYYWSLNRLQYRDAYVNIQVNHYHHIFKVSDTLAYIVIVLMGGCLICLWRKSSR